MYEDKIVDTIDALMAKNFSAEEKAIIFAHVIADKDHNVTNNVLNKISEFAKGNMRVAQALPVIADDPTEPYKTSEPFEILNQDDIDKFLEKMMSKKWEGDFFDDTYESRHPSDVMKLEGHPRIKWDFSGK